MYWAMGRALRGGQRLSVPGYPSATPRHASTFQAVVLVQSAHAEPELFEALPDLLLLVRRDGTVVAHAGGRGVQELGLPATSTGVFEPSWSRRQRRSCGGSFARQSRTRAPSKRSFASASSSTKFASTRKGRIAPFASSALPCARGRRTPWSQRASIEGRSSTGAGSSAGSRNPSPSLRCRERPIAVAVLYIEEIADIAQIIATHVPEQIMSTALARLPARDGDAARRDGISGSSARIFLRSSSSPRIATSSRRVVANVCAKPARTHRRRRRGVSPHPVRRRQHLGVDASNPRVLLDHARAAAAEARRAVSRNVFFFSDTMQLKALDRIDIARELREAIANRAIRLRYTGRHDLRTGR